MGILTVWAKWFYGITDDDARIDTKELITAKRYVPSLTPLEVELIVRRTLENAGVKAHSSHHLLEHSVDEKACNMSSKELEEAVDNICASHGFPRKP
ncbi:MAG: hypothetical protein FWF46_04125 [Oscillospiraceae bacterium]|nr:hypothetical protein [Oscillospiraceae bacterium]